MTEKNKQRAKEFLKDYNFETREIKTREEMLQVKGEFIGTIDLPVKKVIIK